MSTIGTYNGASIIVFPTCPGIKQLNLTMNDTTPVSTSPFTGVQQVQAWPGADFWTADLTLPQMTSETVAEWEGFLGECRGMTNVFYIGHPFHISPRGSASGTPVCNGVTAPMSYTLTTRGWTPNMYRLLLPGDHLQIGYRLHRVLTQVNSDANGDATISVWPSIREATTDGEPVILNHPQGLFRLASNKRSILSAETRLSAVTLSVIEAR